MSMKSRISLISLHLAVGGVLLWAPAATAWMPTLRMEPPADAAAAPAAGEDLASMISMLNSDVLAERENAENWLRSAEEVSLNELLETLVAGELSPEQTLRITHAARARFSARDPGALGVQFDNFNDDGGGAFITGTIENFAAAEFLKAGDQIRSMDGMPVLGYHDVRAAILSRDPGEVIEVGIVRAGQNLMFKIPLAEYSKLPERQNGRSGPNESDLEAAWRVRLARVMRSMRIDGTLPEDRREVRPALSQERWERLDSRVDEARRASVYGERSVPRGGGGPPQMPNIALGGQARSGMRFLHDRFGGGQGGPTRMVFPDPAEQRRQVIDAMRQQIQQLESVRFATLGEIENMKQKLQNGDVPAEVRANLESKMAQLDQRATEFDLRITLLRRQLSDLE